MRKSSLATLIVVALLVGVVALIISDPRPTNTPKLLEDWSRGTPLGIAAWNQPNALEVEPSGERVHVLWFLRAGESGQRQELPVLFAMAVSFRSEKLTQPVLAVFAGGLLKGHQVIARNSFYSLLPQGAADSSGNLHPTWLGKLSEGYRVYYASTVPAMKARLDRTEPGDLAYSAVSALWGLASGLIFLPFVPLILLAPMGWLALYHLAGSGAGLDQRAGRMALTVAVLLYLAAKTVIFVSFFTQPIYGQPLPAPWSQITTCGVPLLIPAFSGLLVAFSIRRRGALAVFPTFIFFALLDITMTIMIYGPVAFGTR